PRGASVVLAIKQTCEWLAIGRSHLWRLIRTGKIRTFKIGKCGVRVSESEVDRFICDGLNESRWNEGVV
ncbi:AlpA family transcriptional regulator, partial [Pseudomonas sp. MPR-AND1A]|uniref:helix-turn-helix transcriptional regulator n=1 Tax=Pseudomonas sp. MPR-AND1A TaxID=2070600 RepID=UPI000CCAFA68